MSDGAVDLKSEARAKAYALPLDEFNVADPELFRSETMWPYFERLRKEDPVHYHKEGLHDDGPYWSVTKYNDIMAIDTNHEVFSSEPSITCFQAASSLSPWNRGTFLSLSEAGRSTPTPSETISPTWAAARRL